MTIHKAKGLGFPVVIVLLYGESSRDSSTRFCGMAMRRRRTAGEDDAGPSRRDPALGALYEEETMKEEVDRLNGLYVALTRAKREMYVIGVKGQGRVSLRPAAR